MQLNHILRTRDLVAKNDSKVGNSQTSSTGDILNGDSFLDHGFTRPKVNLVIFHCVTLIVLLMNRTHWLVNLLP